MIYAIFKYPESGMINDPKKAKDAGLVVGKRYTLEDADVGSWITYITLSEVSGSFNSVQFEFEDEFGNEVDIYHHPDFNHDDDYHW